jgi:hypothetical protein
MFRFGQVMLRKLLADPRHSKPSPSTMNQMPVSLTVSGGEFLFSYYSWHVDVLEALNTVADHAGWRDEVPAG